MSISITAIHKREKLEWLVLIGFFLLIGTLGHDPWWKRGEAYSFGIIYHFYLKHEWLIPINAGFAFMEKPPLYYWTGALLCRALDSLLPLHDAARLASTVYMAISTFFLWKMSRVLYSESPQYRAKSWIAVALFLGTYGVVISCHAMFTDMALLAGIVIALYALAVLAIQPESWIISGLWLGLGTGIAFMSKGLLSPTLIGACSLLLWACSPQLHRRETIRAFLVAALVALPFICIWPILVYHYSPELFWQWLWQNNIGRFVGSSVEKLGAENKRGNLLLMLPVFGFPVFPLACVELWRSRTRWRTPQYLLPLMISCVGLVILFTSASGRVCYLLPQIPGFVLLAVPTLIRLPQKFFAIWNKIVRVLFTLAAIGVWIIWWNLLHPPGQHPITWLDNVFTKMLPLDFPAPAGQPVAIACAFFMLALWGLSLRFRRDGAYNAARIWFTGSALIWCTTYTLLMPWINETRSFRTVIGQLESFVQQSPYAGKCIGNYELGENMGPMLEYFKGPLYGMKNIDDKTCPMLLHFTLRDAPVELGHGWQLAWRGTRLLDIKSSELRLYTLKR